LHLGTADWCVYCPLDIRPLLLGRYPFKTGHAIASATCDDRWHLWYPVWIKFYQISTSIFSGAGKDDCEACRKCYTRVDESTNAVQKSLGKSWGYLESPFRTIFLLRGRLDANHSWSSMQWEWFNLQASKLCFKIDLLFLNDHSFIDMIRIWGQSWLTFEDHCFFCYYWQRKCRHRLHRFDTTLFWWNRVVSHHFDEKILLHKKIISRKSSQTHNSLCLHFSFFWMGFQNHNFPLPKFCFWDTIKLKIRRKDRERKKWIECVLGFFQSIGWVCVLEN